MAMTHWFYIDHFIWKKKGETVRDIIRLIVKIDQATRMTGKSATLHGNML